MATGHSHGPRRRTRDDDAGAGGVDWFRAFDLLVWVSVALIVILAIEWLSGAYIRERIAHGAQKHLAKQPKAADAA